MKVLHRCYMCCSVSLLVVAGVRSQNTRRTETRPTVPNPAMTRVIDQAEPLCREFFPQYDVLRFQAEPSRIFDKGGMRRNMWTIDCQDTRGTDLLHALWDEDQQRLVQIGRSYFIEPYYVRGSDMPIAHISDPEAFRIGRDWVVRLRLAKQEEIQSSRTLLHCFYNIVYVKFYLPTRTIRIAMSAESGEVRGASTYGTSELSLTPASMDTLAAHA